jgi:hypothetical protein
MDTYFRMRIWLGMVAGLAAFALPVWGQNFNFSPTFAGHAAALQLVPWVGDTATLAATGPAPAMGGQRENSLLDVNPVPGVRAQELYAVTVGGASRDRAQASLAYLDARLGSHHVTAQWIESEATAEVAFLSVPTSGKSTLRGLIVDGQLVTATGEVNQTITFPDGYLVINEQSGSSSQHIGTLTVNALHLLVEGEGSLIAASSTAEVIGP